MNELWRQEEKNWQIMNHIGLDYFFYTRNVEGKFTYMSSSIKNLLGFSSQEFIEFNDRILSNHPMNKKAFLCQYKKKTNENPGEGKRTFLIEVYDKNGNLVTLECTEYPEINENKEIEEYRGMGFEVTEKIRQDERLIRAQVELESMNRELQRAIKATNRLATQAQLANDMKTQFLLNMNHEIKTPMNGIMGFLYLLRETELKDEQIEYVKEIERSSLELLGLIEGIIELSQIETKNMKIKHQRFNLYSLINELSGSYQSVFQEKQIHFAVEMDRSTNWSLIGDNEKMKRILKNLLCNSIKFTDDGEIKVMVKKRRENGRKVEIEFVISDTGAGIPQEMLYRIFKPFVQLDGSTRRKHAGTGLGLAITKSIVELMNGKIWVNSQLGKGSSFHILLKFDKA